MAIEWLEVVDRIESGENARTEFKRGFDRSAISRTLCAFANGDGGLLVLGVDDSRNIVGVDENAEKVQEKLTNILQNSCGSPISAECDRYKTDEKWIHWVEVRSRQRSGQPFSYDGRFWIRRGRSSVVPSPSELQELLNTFGLVLTEQQVIFSATVSDIDLGAFRTFMRKQGKAVEEDSLLDIETDLKNASVCNIQDNVPTPTLYGLMVFGRDPQSHPYTTSLSAQFVAYDGTDRAADVLSVGEGKGCLEDQVMRSIGWFRSLAPSG